MIEENATLEAEPELPGIQEDGNNGEDPLGNTEIPIIPEDGNNTGNAGDTEPKVPEKNLDRKFTLKIQGNDEELDEKDVIRYAQKGLGSDRKFQEAHRIRTEAQNIISSIKNDPRGALEYLGIDVNKFAESTLEDEIKRSDMTPDQIESQDWKRRYQQEQSEKNKMEKSASDSRIKEQTQHFHKIISADIGKALEKAGLPRSNSSVKRMAYYMQEGRRNGLPYSPDDVVGTVKKDFEDDFRDIFRNSDGTFLSNLIGKDGIRKIRESELKRVKTIQNIAPGSQKNTQAPIHSKTKSKNVGLMEAREALNKKYGY